jgi:hypothetical protein
MPGTPKVSNTGVEKREGRRNGSMERKREVKEERKG